MKTIPSAQGSRHHLHFICMVHEPLPAFDFDSAAETGVTPSGSSNVRRSLFTLLNPSTQFPLASLSLPPTVWPLHDRIPQPSFLSPLSAVLKTRRLSFLLRSTLSAAAASSSFSSSSPSVNTLLSHPTGLVFIPIAHPKDVAGASISLRRSMQLALSLYLLLYKEISIYFLSGQTQLLPKCTRRCTLTEFQKTPGTCAE